MGSEQANIEAYLAAAEEDGIDVEGATAALEAEEPTAADESALAAFQEDAEKAGVVGIVEDEETGESAEVDAAAFATALEAEEPDASDGSWGLWIPGLGAVIGNALEAVDVAPWLQSLVMDGIVAGVGAVIGFIPQMIILFLLGSRCSKGAATWRASRSSWTVSSAASACRARASSRCSSRPAAACPPSRPRRPSRTRKTVA